MKTKITATAVAALIIAALCTAVYIAKQSNNSDSANHKPESKSPMASETRATKLSVREPSDNLSKISKEEFYTLMISVALISDETERLVAIREKLGMNISDEVYRKALADHGYNPSFTQRRGFIESVFKSWLEEDPIETMRWSNRFNREMRSEFLVSSIENWIETDATTAMAWAEKNLEAKELTAARAKMAEIQQTNADKLSINKIAGQMLAIKDPQGKHEEEHDDLRSRIDRALSAIAKDDPQAALDVFRSFDQKIRNEMFWMEETLYKDFARKDPAAAIASFIAGEVEHKKHANISDLYSIWAQKDPDAAIASAMSLNTEKRGDALLAVLPSWQMKYPDKKIEHAADLTVLNEIQYNTLISQLVESIALTDPAAATAYAMDMEDESMKLKFFTMAASAWAIKDSKKAERWLGTLPEGDLRDQGIARVAHSVSLSNMAQTEQLTTRISDPEFRHEVIVNIITENDNIRSDLPGTLQLANQLPSIDTDSLNLMILNLSPKDAYHFEVWLRETSANGRITYSSESKTKEFQEMLDKIKAMKYEQK